MGYIGVNRGSSSYYHNQSGCSDFSNSTESQQKAKTIAAVFLHLGLVPPLLSIFVRLLLLLASKIEYTDTHGDNACR